MRKKISETIINVTKISTGTILGQIISIITLPFITRIYGAEIMGIWALIFAYSNIIQNICDLGLSNSLMVCPEYELKKRYNIVTKLSFVLSVLCSIIVSLYYLMINSSPDFILTIFTFVGIYSFTLRQINTCGIILNRNKKYDLLMKNSIIRFSVQAGVALGLGYMGFIKYGYYIANIIGQVLTVRHMKKCLPKLDIHNNKDDFVDTIKSNINFVKYQMPASITVNLRTELPNLLIGSLFGNAILGYYSISQKLLTIPITFLGQALGKVFYQKIAELKIKGIEIGNFVRKSINKGMIIALFPMMLFAAYGDAAIVLFFGEEYYIGGIICRIMAYRSLFNFISTATQGIDIVLDKQEYVLYTCLSQTILALASVITGYYLFDSIYVTTFLLVSSFILIQIIFFCKMYFVMNLSISNYLKRIFIILVIMFIGSFLLRWCLFAIFTFFNCELFSYLYSLFTH